MTPDQTTLTALQSIVTRYLRPGGARDSVVDPRPAPLLREPYRDAHDALGEIIAVLEAAGYGAFGAGKMGAATNDGRTE